MTPHQYGPWTTISDHKTTTWHKGWKRKLPNQGSVHYYVDGRPATYKEFIEARDQGKFK